ncbi:MAG: tol-pal system protein YbgF [Pseudomonadota bacterium]
MSVSRGALSGLALVAACAATLPVYAAEPRPAGGAPVVSATQPNPGPALEARVAKLERLLEGQALADLALRVQQLQQDLQSLRGELEVQANEMNGLKQRQRDVYLDIDRRLQQLSATAPATPAATPAVAVAAPEQEQAAYQRAFDKMKEGRYDEAIILFRGLLANHPNGKLVDNAQYWLGEANYVTRRYREAADEFGKVIAAYPQSPKVPDALLKQGFSYYELGEWAKARETLEQFLARYPQHAAVARANERLQALKAKGR